MPLPALQELPAPDTYGLNDLQAMLAQQEVANEMANPAGLRFDEPVTDAVTQYKADVRAILADEPQDLTTALAAKESIIEEFVVPEANVEEGEYEPPPIDPPPDQVPVISSLDPTRWPVSDDTGTLTVAGSNLHPLSIISFNQLQRPTTWLSESEITCEIPSWPTPGDVSVTVDTAGLTSAAATFTYEAV
jgi:IPT/TIG domain-containing protein